MDPRALTPGIIGKPSNIAATREPLTLDVSLNAICENNARLVELRERIMAAGDKIHSHLHGPGPCAADITAESKGSGLGYALDCQNGLINDMTLAMQTLESKL